jgi:hypothetical protein
MEADKTAQELITIAGGVDLEVAYRDNRSREIIKVRQIPISKIQEFMLTLGNESRTIEIYCDKPEGWGDTLSMESASEIADKGQEINLPFFDAWWKRQAKWRKMQINGEGMPVGAAPPSASVNSVPVLHTPTT